MNSTSKCENDSLRNNSSRLILGVDLDNVLALTDSLIRKLIKKIFKISLQQNNIIEFDYYRCGINKEQNRIVLDCFHSVECSNVKPIKDAIEALQSLLNKFTIYIVTSRPPQTRNLTLQWIKRHKIPFDKLIFIKTKRDSKTSFNIFIEDHRETAYSMARKGVISFLLDYPWNQPNPVDPPNLYRVKSWREIKEHLLKLSI